VRLLVSKGRVFLFGVFLYKAALALGKKILARKYSNYGRYARFSRIFLGVAPGGGGLAYGNLL
jgi:hypothetical protein